MKHPDREEWVPFVFGEAAPKARRELGKHLASCSDCRTEIEAWQRSLGRLDAWKLSSPPAERLDFRPVVKWAIAAVLMISVGFSLGRSTSSNPPNAPELEAYIKATVNQMVALKVNAALAQAQIFSTGALGAAETRLAQASDLQLHHALSGFVEILDAGREEERRALRVLLQDLQQQHTADLLTLRRDLETVASTTEEKIRQTRWNLTQLTSSP